MTINYLSLHNFRSFKNFEISFDEKLTVIVAENAVGKTAILDAVAISLGTFIGGFDTGVNKGFSINDARLKIIKKNDFGTNTMESSYPILLKAEGTIKNESIKWERSLSGSKSKTTNTKAKLLRDYAKNLQESVREEKNVTLPIVSYYGTGRLWDKKNLTKKFSSKISRSRLFGYNKALESASTYNEFNKWFTDESRNINDIIINMIIKENYVDSKDILEKVKEIKEINQLNQVKKAINECLKTSQWSNISFDSEFKEITVDHPTQGTIPISRLSDGVRNMIAMVSDIAYRCIKLNPHLKDSPYETKGIVLIDEVDMHLHPLWQQKVIQSLQNAFGNIQFIMTTHSPQVISSIEGKHIRVIDPNLDVSSPTGTSGAESIRILKDVFGTDARSPENKYTKLLNEYKELVYTDKWSIPRALEIRKKLDEQWQNSEPYLQKIDLYIENKEWEMKYLK